MLASDTFIAKVWGLAPVFCKTFRSSNYWSGSGFAIAEPLVPKFASLFGGPPIVLGAPLIFWRPPHQVWGTFFWFGAPPPSAFGGTFGGPPIVWGHPHRTPKILASKIMTPIIWRPPHRIWRRFWGAPNRLGASPSNLGALFWVDLEPRNVKNRMILNDFDRKSYAYTYKFCRNHTILKELKVLTERAYCIPRLVQVNAFEFEGLHIICAGAMNKENGIL